jgi:hypothetical protein
LSPLLSPAVDPSGTVVADLLCRRCQYNLRTLALAGRCPECGLSVGFSAQGDRLCFSDPAWVLAVRRGALFILAGIAVTVLGIALTVGVTMLEGEGRDVSGVVASAVGLGAFVLFFVGGWLLTVPDPSGLGEDRYGTSRKVIRVTLLIGAAGQLVDLVEEGFSVDPSLHLMLRLVWGLAALTGLVGTFAELHYIAKLAARIPDETTVKRANFLKWALVGAIGLFFVGGFCAAALAGAVGAGCVVFVALLGVIVLFVMYLFMLIRLARALNEQARYAMTTWAAGDVHARGA